MYQVRRRLDELWKWKCFINRPRGTIVFDSLLLASSFGLRGCHLEKKRKNCTSTPCWSSMAYFVKIKRTKFLSVHLMEPHLNLKRHNSFMDKSDIPTSQLSAKALADTGFLHSHQALSVLQSMYVVSRMAYITTAQTADMWIWFKNVCSVWFVHCVGCCVSHLLLWHQLLLDGLREVHVVTLFHSMHKTDDHCDCVSL